MRKDNLERFIRDNREDFDDKEPSLDLWRKIEAGLPAQPPDEKDSTPDQARLDSTFPFGQIHKNGSESDNNQLGQARLGQSRHDRSGWSWSSLDWRVAASIAVLLLAGSFLYMNHQYGVTRQPEVVAVGPTYAKEVVQYTRLIDDKRAELKHMTEDNPALYEEFATDLNRLEKSYQSLKADLPKNPNQEMLIQAMIQNLQIQINLLNEQLRVIQRIKQQTNENQNPV
ncbi:MULTISPECIES: hypothetical protein [Spirosoma]|uniref:Anti-sigma factor n=1 Tax=Spirosoma liriopis TaxID=2937440 RepID=A0ABT0HKM3_9BACT|nr:MULTISPECIES: hypothetical protein [Spirosoma]MCK8492218.1 hypothetical protein [Spirosoma liriopis]UHG93621.1 hypothetical protein LQ777_01760 [Spirosoma oryzicola]